MGEGNCGGKSAPIFSCYQVIISSKCEKLEEIQQKIKKTFNFDRIVKLGVICALFGFIFSFSFVRRAYNSKTSLQILHYGVD